MEHFWIKPWIQEYTANVLHLAMYSFELAPLAVESLCKIKFTAKCAFVNVWISGYKKSTLNNRKSKRQISYTLNIIHWQYTGFENAIWLLWRSLFLLSLKEYKTVHRIFSSPVMKAQMDSSCLYSVCLAVIFFTEFSNSYQKPLSYNLKQPWPCGNTKNSRGHNYSKGR